LGERCGDLAQLGAGGDDLGFSVLVLPLFEPIRLAEEIATLDVLSEGRVDFGVQ